MVEAVTQVDLDRMLLQLKGQSSVGVSIINSAKLARVVANDGDINATVCYVALQPFNRVKVGDILGAGKNNHPILVTKASIFDQEIDFSFLFETKSK